MRESNSLELSLLLAGMVFMSTACNPGQKAWTHDEEWSNPEFKDTRDFHGTVVKNRGNNTLMCKICHGADLNGSTDNPGCYVCHFGPDGSRSPSGSLWGHGLFEHNRQISEQTVCNTCHDLYRSYGLNPGACHDCHAIAPAPGLHPMGQTWLDRKSEEFHGKSTLMCSSCHDLASRCAICHFDETGSKSPVGSGWAHGTVPHEGLASSEAVCNQCHVLERSYGNGPASCHDCHTHVTGQPWLDPKSAEFHGGSTLNCGTCHDTAAECSSCHFGATGSKVPVGSGWAHGTVPHNKLSSWKTVCNTCHDLNRSYGNGPAACHDCHGQQRHIQGKAWLDPKSEQFHGTSTLDCSSCHDLNTECSSCHQGSSGNQSPTGRGRTRGNR